MYKYLIHVVTTELVSSRRETRLLGDGGYTFVAEHQDVKQFHFRHFISRYRTIETEADVRSLELEIRKETGFPEDEVCVNIMGWEELK